MGKRSITYYSACSLFLSLFFTHIYTCSIHLLLSIFFSHSHSFFLRVSLLSQNFNFRPSLLYYSRGRRIWNIYFILTCPSARGWARPWVIEKKRSTEIYLTISSTGVKVLNYWTMVMIFVTIMIVKTIVKIIRWWWWLVLLWPTKIMNKYCRQRTFITGRKQAYCVCVYLFVWESVKWVLSSWLTACVLSVTVM